MSCSSTSQFVTKIQAALVKVPGYLATQSGYVDLSRLQTLTTIEIANFSFKPPDNPFSDVFCRIMHAGETHHLEQVNFGCNELLKSYLLQVNRDNQEPLTKAYAALLQLIFIWCLDYPFIYLPHFWRYLVDCLNVVTHFILEQEYFQATLILIDYLGFLGQGAVKHGLSTQRLQRLLRKLEIRSEEMSWIHGARQCRQQRHDIEVI